MSIPKHWVIASDGSGYLPKTDVRTPGSFAATIFPLVSNDIVELVNIKVGGSMPGTTNGEMEVAGAGHGLYAFRKVLSEWDIPMEGMKVTVIVDAQYVYCAYNQHPTKPEQGFWMKSWKERGWKTSSGGTVKNQKLWHFLNREIKTLESKGVEVCWVWVPGHDSSSRLENRLNNKADSMCTSLVLDLISKLNEDSNYRGEKPWYSVLSESVNPAVEGLPQIGLSKRPLFCQRKED